MATSQQVDEFRLEQAAIVGAATGDFDEFWAALADMDLPPARVAELVSEYAVDAVGTYGAISSSSAADWFESLAPGAARAAMVAPPSEKVAKSSRWAVSGLFTGKHDPVSALRQDVIDRLVKQAGRETIDLSVSRDRRARYARVPRGATCAFCMMMASRGPVYGSERKALGADKYHGHCDCVAVPVWSDADLPEDYARNLRTYEDAYRLGRRDAGSGDPKDILAAMRRITGAA